MEGSGREIGRAGTKDELIRRGYDNPAMEKSVSQHNCCWRLIFLKTNLVPVIKYPATPPFKKSLRFLSW